MRGEPLEAAAVPAREPVVAAALERELAPAEQLEAAVPEHGPAQAAVAPVRRRQQPPTSQPRTPAR